MFSSPFTEPEKPEFRIVFVQDFFLSDLVGGAELSMDALHRSSPIPFAVIRASQLSQELVETHRNCHWAADREVLPECEAGVVLLSEAYATLLCQISQDERRKV